MKSLVVVFSSFNLEKSTSDYNIERQKEYAACYRQLHRVIPENFDILFIDNSINSFDEIKSTELREVLSGSRLLLTAQNFGERNKGVGELVMLIQSSQAVNFLEYEKICYCTGRKFFTCPYPFEKAIETNKEATVSNPDFQFLNGEFRSVAKNMFNDMFFAMNSKTMIQFIEFTKPRLQIMESHMINSESNLYEFIYQNKIDFQFLEFLGIIRNEQNTRDPYLSIENFHIC